MSTLPRASAGGSIRHSPLSRGRADERDYRVHIPERHRCEGHRAKLDMTQEEFAGRFGFSVNTLRHWEQGSRQPEGPTRA